MERSDEASKIEEAANMEHQSKQPASVVPGVLMKSSTPVPTERSLEETIPSDSTNGSVRYAAGSNHHATAIERPSTPKSPGRCSPVRIVGSMSPTRSAYLVAGSPEAAGMERLHKMILAHEIAVNDQFRLQDVASPPPPNTVEAHIRDTIQQAFWDALETSLSEDPPNYAHAMVLLEEIRETLISFLPRNQRSPVAELIRNNLDMNHIRHRAELGVLDIKEISGFIIEMMGKLCAPARDDEIAALSSIEDTVTLFKEVFRVLEEMKMDMLQFALSQVKPIINHHAVEYEQQMFEEFLSTQPEPLYQTKEWLRDTALQLLSLPEEPTISGASPWKISPTRILRTAFVGLLDALPEVWPETLVADITRFEAVHLHCEVAILTASVILITWNAVGPFLTKIPDFKSKLRDEVKTLLETMPAGESETLIRISEHVAAQMEKMVTDESAEQPNFHPALENVRQQISALTNRDQPIRHLLTKRVKDFAASVLTSSAKGIPAGLACVEEEVTQSIGLFARTVSRNQVVFGKYYSKVISGLADELNLRTVVQPEVKANPQ